MRTWLWGVLGTGILVLVLSSCGGGSPSTRKDPDPEYKTEIEQVRYERKGIFPFDFLLGHAFLTTSKPISSKPSWGLNDLVRYNDKKLSIIKIIEDNQMQRVLTLKPVDTIDKRLNVAVLVMVSKGMMVGPGGGTDIHPKLRETLKLLVEKGIKDTKLYNLAIIFCWGKVERRYPIMSEEAADQYLADMDSLIYPGDSEGSYMSCLEPTLADLDWLQRATPEEADAATLKHGTLPMFIRDDVVDSRNYRTNVILLTDGEPFREGPLDVFTDQIVKGNFGLYTVGVPASPEGEKGLARIEELYLRKKMGGRYIGLLGHDELPTRLMKMIDRWQNGAYSYVATYLSNFSGKRGSTVPVEVERGRGLYTTQQVKAAPPTYNWTLNSTFMVLVVLFVIGLFVYLLYHFRIWPFRERVRVIACPEGCGHMIPEDWPTCKFCELKGVWGRLIVLNGDRAGRVFYLKSDYYSMGSGRDDDIILTNLPDFPVQPAHASFHWVQQGQKIVLKADSGPLKVDQRNVSGSAANLRFGDIIEVGEGGIAAVLLRGVGRSF